MRPAPRVLRERQHVEVAMAMDARRRDEGGEAVDQWQARFVRFDAASAWADATHVSGP